MISLAMKPQNRPKIPRCRIKGFVSVSVSVSYLYFPFFLHGKAFIFSRYSLQTAISWTLCTLAHSCLSGLFSMTLPSMFPLRVNLCKHWILRSVSNPHAKKALMAPIPGLDRPQPSRHATPSGSVPAGSHPPPPLVSARYDSLASPALHISMLKIAKSLLWGIVTGNPRLTWGRVAVSSCSMQHPPVFQN